MDAGACALVGEAKGSLALTDELPACPPSRSANKQNKAEDFAVEFLALALAAALCRGKVRSPVITCDT